MRLSLFIILDYKSFLKLNLTFKPSSINTTNIKRLFVMNATLCSPFTCIIFYFIFIIGLLVDVAVTVKHIGIANPAVILLMYYYII